MHAGYSEYLDRQSGRGVSPHAPAAVTFTDELFVATALSVIYAATLGLLALRVLTDPYRDQPSPVRAKLRYSFAIGALAMPAVATVTTAALSTAFPQPMHDALQERYGLLLDVTGANVVLGSQGVISASATELSDGTWIVADPEGVELPREGANGLAASRQMIRDFGLPCHKNDLSDQLTAAGLTVSLDSFGHGPTGTNPAVHLTESTEWVRHPDYGVLARLLVGRGDDCDALLVDTSTGELAHPGRVNGVTAPWERDPMNTRVRGQGLWGECQP